MNPLIPSKVSIWAGMYSTSNDTLPQNSHIGQTVSTIVPSVQTDLQSIPVDLDVIADKLLDEVNPCLFSLFEQMLSSASLLLPHLL